MAGIIPWHTNPAVAELNAVQRDRRKGGPIKMVNPWIEAQQDKKGIWKLPEYPCEIPDLPDSDPRKKMKWKPGDWVDGVDNVEQDMETQEQIVWGGLKMWSGEDKPHDFDEEKLTEEERIMIKIPHMPGQPAKEGWARMKELLPHYFEDKHIADILWDMPKEWPRLWEVTKWYESFGVLSKGKAGDEWRGHEIDCVPFMTASETHPQSIVISVGQKVEKAEDAVEVPEVPAAMFDYLEFLYAKDQEGKLIMVWPYAPNGIFRTIFNSYSFSPPQGTKSITPYAAFKVRGAWKGETVTWDPTKPNKAMEYFTGMSLEARAALAEHLPPSVKRSMPKPPKETKPDLVVWPEGSWEANCAAARAHDAAWRARE